MSANNTLWFKQLAFIAVAQKPGSESEVTAIKCCQLLSND